MHALLSTSLHNAEASLFCAGKWLFLVSFLWGLSQCSLPFKGIIMGAGQMLMPLSMVEVMLLGQWVCSSFQLESSFVDKKICLFILFSEIL
jgi:hypothetical protein